MKWEKLPSDTAEICDHHDVKWSKGKVTSDRCEKPATRINRSKCFCGACDMTYRLCSEHAAEHLATANKYGVAEPGLA